MIEFECTTGNKKVDEMAMIQFVGNVIPQVWYKTILRENGKPDLLAISILADIVYWYRPTEVRDEETGKFIGYVKKFKDKDMLQRSYSQYSELFGESKRSVTDAVIRLEKTGVIQRVFRSIEVGGIVYNNVLFIDLFVDKLCQLTFPQVEKAKFLENEYESDTPPTKFRERGPEIPGEGSRNLERGVTEFRERGPEIPGEESRNLGIRNTKITTKITSNISSSSSDSDDEDIVKERIGYFGAIRSFSLELVEAIYAELSKNPDLLECVTPELFMKICSNISGYFGQVSNKTAYIRQCIENMAAAQHTGRGRSPNMQSSTNSQYQQFMHRTYDYAAIERDLTRR